MKQIKKYFYPTIFALLIFIVLIAFQFCGRSNGIKVNSKNILNGKNANTISTDNIITAATIPFSRSIATENSVSNIATGGNIERAQPHGSKNTYVAFRIMYNGQYVSVNADKSLQVADGDLSKAGLFQLIRISSNTFALKSALTGNYVYATPTSGVMMANGSNLDSYAKFEAVDKVGFQLNWKNIGNQNFVSLDENLSGKLIANRNSANSWELFKLMPVFDMAQVISAFADQHSHEAKQRTERSNTGIAYYDNQMVLDRRIQGKNELVITQVSWDGVKIYDWLWISEEKIGLHGTFPIFPGAKVHITDPMVPFFTRYLTPDSVGQKVNGKFNFLSGLPDSPKFTFKDTGNLPNYVSYIGMRELRGNIGKRWVITTASDLTNQPRTICESNSYAPGPS
jgi:hypothetical protein